MLRYSAVGTAGEVRSYLSEFAGRTKADELITVHQVPDAEARLGSVTLLAGAAEGW